MLTGSKYVLVRWLAEEARLAFAYVSGAGSEFIETLVAFEAATVDFSAKSKTLSPLEPDGGRDSNIVVMPERWFGLLIAGVICSGTNLIANLGLWLDSSSHLLGDGAALTRQIRLLLEGASQPAELLEPSVARADLPAALRCGAAAKLLLGTLPAAKTLQAQGFLASALVSDGSYTRQELFNNHVARNFATPWRVHAQNQFQFHVPRTSVPPLLRALDDIERGSGTLGGVLVTAANALERSLGEFMGRVL
jgi:hypothetical protein